MAPPAACARAGSAPTPSRRSARGARARVLRRVQPVGACREARAAPRHHQKSDVRGALSLARPARGAGNGDVMDLHELTAAYAVDALDADEAEAYEKHLSQCDECREQLAGLNEAAGHLAYAAVAPAPPARLGAAILERAAAERSNVVPLLRRRWVARGLAVAAAAAACVVVGLAVALSQSSQKSYVSMSVRIGA